MRGFERRLANAPVERVGRSKGGAPGGVIGGAKSLKDFGRFLLKKALNSGAEVNPGLQRATTGATERVLQAVAWRSEFRSAALYLDVPLNIRAMRCNGNFARPRDGLAKARRAGALVSAPGTNWEGDHALS